MNYFHLWKRNVYIPPSPRICSNELQLLSIMLFTSTLIKEMPKNLFYAFINMKLNVQTNLTGLFTKHSIFPSGGHGAGWQHWPPGTSGMHRLTVCTHWTGSENVWRHCLTCPFFYLPGASRFRGTDWTSRVQRATSEYRYMRAERMIWAAGPMTLLPENCLRVIPVYMC